MSHRYFDFEIKRMHEDIAEWQKKRLEHPDCQLTLTGLSGEGYMITIPGDVTHLKFQDCTFTSLPNLPPKLESLDITNFHGSSRLKYLFCDDLPKSLTSIFFFEVHIHSIVGELPPNLERLWIPNGKFKKLPELPNTLKILSCSSTNVEALPYDLPPLLEELHIENTNIKHLPYELPETLRDLLCDNTLIKYLPRTLPPHLEILSISNTKIEELPSLPDSLEILYMSNTPIKTLPDKLPTSLYDLELDNTKLTKLPNEFPDTLECLYITSDIFPKMEEDETPNAYLKRVRESATPSHE